jgi:hypothetical protein
LFTVDSNNRERSIGDFSQGTSVPNQVTVSYPATPQEYLAFKFVFTSSAGGNLKTPLFTGYQLKSLPAVKRQRLIQYPLVCYDRETDKFGNMVGYEGRAYDRLELLEGIESAGDTIRIQDFRTGESYIGLIEELDFINRTPTDKRFSGFGGILLCTIRSV